jgi:hypothetical protein
MIRQRKIDADKRISRIAAFLLTIATAMQMI